MTSRFPKNLQRKLEIMNAFSKIDMREVTRLTQAGKLTEAMALLKGGLAPTILKQSSPGAVPHAGTNPKTANRDVVDLVAPSHAGGVWTSATDLDEHIPKLRDALHSFNERIVGHTAISDLAAGSRPAQKTQADSQEKSRFIEQSFSNAVGTRSYKVYVPSGYLGQQLPLVVMLHGCTQNPDDFAAGTKMNELAEELTFLVAYPRQPQSANMQKCWNWFDVDNQRRDGGEASLIAGITMQVVKYFNADPTRIYVAGLSAGGAAAAILAATYPDLFAAAGVHSGLACGAATDMVSAFAAMNGRRAVKEQPNGRMVPTIVFHGDADRTVNAINGDQVAMQASSGLLHAKDITRGEEAGRAYTRTVERNAAGVEVVEHWKVHGAGHAWSGGSADGSYTDMRGPDASREMIQFFLKHRNERIQ